MGPPVDIRERWTPDTFPRFIGSLNQMSTQANTPKPSIQFREDWITYFIKDTERTKTLWREHRPGDMEAWPTVKTLRKILMR